jgi:hypothetical protein
MGKNKPMYKLQFKDDPNRSIWLVGERIKLGSDQGNDVILSGLGIEAFHAEIEIGENQLKLSMEPGTCLVNELPVDRGYQLQANDELKIGSERLLILDPKWSDTSVNQTKTTGSIGSQSRSDKLTGWSLQALHPKLKERNFQIGNNTVVGRAKECGFSIPYKMLSREHAVFKYTGDDLVIEDLNSSNGTYLNGEQVTESTLHHDDVLAFGKLSFTVQAPASQQTSQPVDMNRTMVRPALDMDKLLAETGAQEIIDFDAAVEASKLSSSHVVVAAEEATASGKKWWVFTLVLVSAAAYWWFKQSA